MELGISKHIKKKEREKEGEREGERKRDFQPFKVLINPCQSNVQVQKYHYSTYYFSTLSLWLDQRSMIVLTK